MKGKSDFCVDVKKEGFVNDARANATELIDYCMQKAGVTEIKDRLAVVQLATSMILYLSGSASLDRSGEEAAQIRSVAFMYEIVSSLDVHAICEPLQWLPEEYPGSKTCRVFCDLDERRKTAACENFALLLSAGFPDC